MAAVIGLIVGILVGGIATDSGFGALAGGVIGAFAGYFLKNRGVRNGRPSEPHAPVSDAVTYRLASLERRVTDLERELRATGVRTPATEAGAGLDIEEPVFETPVVPARAVALAPVPAEETTESLPTAVAIEAAPPERALPRGDAIPPPPPNPIWAWIVGGNTLARVGVAAAVHRRRLPAQVHGRARARADLGAPRRRRAGRRRAARGRLATARASRRAYAMVLQGGGVGVLYLTVFAALRLYALVPPLAAFGLLVWISALSSWLAVRQDAISLAALAVAGGFLAPILTSSQTRQSRDAVQLLRAAQRRHPRHRVVQGVARRSTCWASRSRSSSARSGASRATGPRISRRRSRS